MEAVLFIVGAVLLFYISWRLNNKGSEKNLMSTQEIEKEEERILMNTKKESGKSFEKLGMSTQRRFKRFDGF